MSLSLLCQYLPWGSDQLSASCVAVVILCVIAGYVVGSLSYNLFFHPLRKYPGPTPWAASRIPYAIACATGHGHETILRLHEKYGDIVRVAPTELSLCSPDAWKEVFGRRKTEAGEIAKDSVHYAEAKDSILGAPKDKHTQLRRILTRGFSNKAMLDQEELITSHIDQLFRILSEHEAEKGWEVPIDMNKLFDFVSLDIITDLGFGDSFHCLRTGTYHPWAKFFLDALEGIALATAIKQFQLVFKLLMALAPKSLIRKHEDMVQMTNAMVEKRLEEADRPDFIRAMSQPVSGSEKPLDLQEIKSNAQILTMAGYDTTATALAGAAYLLATNATVTAKLKKEVRGAFQSESEINMQSTKDLSYLTAVINEAMRVYPPGGSGMPRRVPKGGDVIFNQYIPENTILSLWQYAIYHSERNFSQPEAFIPERWLDGSNPAFISDRKEAFQPFSFGPRDCMGRNLAFAELRIILAKLIWKFDFELAHESDKNWMAEQKNYLLWERGPLNMRLKHRGDETKS